MTSKGIICILCNTSVAKDNFVHELKYKPPRETDFNIPKEKYFRTI